MNMQQRKEQKRIRRNKRLHDYYLRLEKRRKEVSGADFKAADKRLRPSLWKRILRFIKNLFGRA